MKKNGSLWIIMENNVDPSCLPLAEILRVQPEKIASGFLGYLPRIFIPVAVSYILGFYQIFFAGCVYYQIEKFYTLDSMVSMVEHGETH